MASADSCADGDRTGTGSAGSRPSNRRDLILEAAINLFRAQGYPGTSVDDIGRAVEVSGPAIYRHFDSKEDLLMTAIQMAAREVHAGNEQARSQTSDPQQLLDGYIRAYTTVALERSALISVWTSEARHLSGDHRAPMDQRLRSWRDEWVEALQASRPDLDAETARLLVTGALGLITTLATAGPASEGGDRRDTIAAMAMAILQTSLA